jgi:hypothetical protein
MKKAIVMLLAAALIFTIAACSASQTPAPGNTGTGNGQSADNESPHPPEGSEQREMLHIYIDGQSINESGYAYTDIVGSMAGNKIDGTYYYGASVAKITGKDISSIKGAFLEAVDGYVSYVSDIDNLYLAAYSAKDGKYQSIVLDNRHVYGGITPGGSMNKGVVNVYLVSTPADFAVEIQKNGQKVGVLTMEDFMKKTPVADKKVATSMFDGSFMYQGGAATYQGRFLGISYQTMLAKLASMNIDLSGNITEVEYYGTNGLGVQGKNQEYSTTEGDPKYFGSTDFFCMFDGRTYNDVTTDCPIGLTAFINGTGGRWMTYNLSTINFIVE